jgi:hypothetical protein
LWQCQVLLQSLQSRSKAKVLKKKLLNNKSPQGLLF